MKRLICLTGLAAVAACSLVALAVAGPPERTEQVVPVTVVYQPCGAVESVTYAIRRTRFEDGRIQLQVSFEGTITVPRTGETVAESGHQTLVVGADGTFAFSGVAFNVRIPGQGVILLEAGRLVFDPDGNVVQQSARTAADLAQKVCAALG